MIHRVTNRETGTPLCTYAYRMHKYTRVMLLMMPALEILGAPLHLSGLSERSSHWVQRSFLTNGRYRDTKEVLYTVFTQHPRSAINSFRLSRQSQEHISLIVKFSAGPV